MSLALNTVLFCAATVEELETIGKPESFAAVTGTGIPVTLLRLVPLLERIQPSLIVNTGIAGAYAGSGLDIGDVVIGTSEVFADLGMELPDSGQGEGFRPLSDFSFADGTLHKPLPLFAPPAWTGPGLKRGHGATVNACTGTDETGARRRHLFEADFESMEGAAVALAGHEQGIPVIEVRAISNIAARRDMRPENIRRALEALALFWAKHREGLPGSSL